MLFSTTCINDESLGPAVLGCRSDFDFTILFELTFFSLVPSCTFILLALWQIQRLFHKRVMIYAPHFQLLKLLGIALFVALRLVLVIMVALQSFNIIGLFKASSALELVAALLMLPVSFFDHGRSPRPSMLLNSYLSLTLLFDIAQTRTFWLSSVTRSETAYTIVFTSTVAAKTLVLLLESRPKTEWVEWEAKEPHSPEETSGVFGLGVYFWLNNLFLKGYGSNLSISDLYPLDHALKVKSIEGQFRHRLDYSKFKDDKYGLVKLLCRSYAVPLLLPVIPRLFKIAFTFCQPFFMESLLTYLSQDASTVSDNFGYGLIGASVLIYFGLAISTGVYQYLHYRSLQILRGCLATAIYARGAELQAGSDQDSASVTLMSADLERIRLGLRNLHDMWAGVIEVGISSWLLYNQLRLAFLAPIILVFICFSLTFYMARFMGPSQKAWMEKVEQRVGLTATVIGNMKTFKITGMTEPVETMVQAQRLEELGAGSRFRRFIIITASLGYVPLFLAPAFTFAVAQNSLDTIRMFTSLSWLNLLTTPLTLLFQAIPTLLAAIACLQRIQTYLESDPRVDFREAVGHAKDKAQHLTQERMDTSSSEQATSDFAISVKNGEFGWKQDKMVLQDINFNVAQCSFTIVCGPIASGKSTLCQAMLGEVPFFKGSIQLGIPYSSIAYCAQTPFLSNGTVRSNIVGFAPLDPHRYSEVIHATMLDIDFQSMDLGDQLVIGSNGITLSGGQKQRVALARALYLQASLLIFDDVFSGLDADTEEQVFRRVFGLGGLLRHRRSTFLLCTHSVRHLPAADHIIALDASGYVVEQGDFVSLMKNQSGYVNSLGVKASQEETTDIEHHEGPSPTIESITRSVTDALDAVPEVEDTSRRLGDKSIYGTYIKSMGYALSALILLFGILLGFSANFATIWLKYWADDAESTDSRHSFSYWIGVYFLLGFGAVLSLASLGVMVLQLSVSKAGASLHHGILRTLVVAPLSFFTRTDQGEILNLFSQDMNLIDTELPLALINVVYAVFTALGQAAVLATSSVWLIISYPFLVILLWFIARFYLRTSRQLRLLDLEAKSPLYAHFLDTTKGIVTLRAFGTLSQDRAKNVELVDTSQRPAYLLQMVQNWLNLVLGFVIMVVSAVLTTLVVTTRANAGFTGASMVTLMAFGTELTFIVLALTQLETSLGAISRCKNFNEDVKSEDKEQEVVVPEQSWPQTGLIEMKGVSASYNDDNDDIDRDEATWLALNNVALAVSPGEKVAVCGRTGSGKSSLIALLLKLLDPTLETATNVEIDGIGLHKINRQVLRRRIIVVPQDAVFLKEKSSFKANLDPFDTADSSACQSVLETVKLWSFVEDCGGLEASMSSAAFSQGQKQLFSLACAVLRRRVRAGQLGYDADVSSEGGILLMDEVSSSVDRETERVMQQVIKDEFTNYTVIAITHRLDMVLDFDTVVVMDKGKVVEKGNPRALSQDSSTRFGDLWKTSNHS
ncbi:putative ABC multidrug transporter [Fusarium flagelliforme]|uniref:putative ABC multidrug transporter n=1 Tax=Fusarium flagelliforme TaxID=2675880 RepID=UPI001E8EB7E3|nr:putative ABC multidrug transporter [Fusarium flagelliforme]KAH7182283.1 putative ABC multidrug transporter [Fusarium flagelliforme]